MALTERPVSTPAYTPTDEVPGIVAAVKAAYATGRTRTLGWREAQLDGLDRMLDLEAERLLNALAADVGKPSLEAYATDIGIVRGEIKDLRKNTAKWMKPRKASLALNSRPGKGYLVAEPYGVSLIIGPWNYPVQLIIEPLAAAIAAGNAAIIKPSEVAPATSAALAELIPRYLDSEAIAVVQGDAPVATALLAERYDHVFFTGSTAVGRIVYEAAAKNLTPVTLELGGKSPVIVDDSVNVDVAAHRIAWGKWLNAGQTCIAPDYVLVSEAKRDELVSAIGAAFEEFAAGTTPADNADYGSIVNSRHTERIGRMLDEHGGTVAVGGHYDPATRYVDPTVIVDPDLNSPLMQEEIFGPVLPVITAASVEAAIEFVNEREKPLALYVFSENDEVTDHVIANTSAGGTVINHVLLHCGPGELPFGGVGESGIGRYHGESGFEEFSNMRAVLKKPTRPDVKLLYPPYTAKKEKLIRRFL